MPLILRVSPHLTHDELVRGFLECTSKDEKLRWQAVMLKAEDRTAKDIAAICKRNEDWVRRTVRRFNELGADGLADLRKNNGRQPLLDERLRGELLEALEGCAPDGGLWTAPKVADWIERKIGHKVDDHTGWMYLKRLGFTRQLPRPQHPDASKEAQEAFKKGGFRAALTTSFESTLAPRSRSGRKMRPVSG